MTGEIPGAHPEIPSGVNLRTVLGGIYQAESAIYVDRGWGRDFVQAAVTADQIAESGIRFVKNAEGNTAGSSTQILITPDLIVGHFRVVPAWKRTQAAIELAQNRYQNVHPGKTLMPESIEHGHFENIIVEGAMMGIDLERTVNDLERPVYNATVKTNTNSKLSTIEGMKFKVVDLAEYEGLTGTLPTQEIERAAQAAGTANGDFDSALANLPMFTDFYDATFSSRAQLGDYLVMRPVVSKVDRVVSGGTSTFSSRGKIAEVKRMDMLMFPASTLNKVIEREIARAESLRGGSQ